MRFKRYHRFVFTVTPRSRAAAARAIQRQSDKIALFVAGGIEKMPTVDERIENQRQSVMASDRNMRDWRADQWRRARANLFARSDNERAALLHFWNNAPYPGDPSYLLGVLDRFDAGKLELDIFERARENGARLRREWDAKRKQIGPAGTTPPGLR